MGNMEQSYMLKELAGSDVSAYDQLAQLCKQQVQRGMEEAGALERINAANEGHLDSY